MRGTWMVELSDAGARTDGDPRRSLPLVPSLDGVRAIAVLAVLLFHGSVAGLRGGFLGVDVFFVLSGFLITSLLLAEAESTGRLDLRRFYLRRARRLLPALLLVLVATSVLALTVARDAALQVRDDTVAVLTYTTNWWFVAQDRSYFAEQGRPPLLQHLWSLAVEEQFYLLWPLLLLLIWRTGHRVGVRRWALGGAVASTVLMAVWAGVTGVPGSHDPSRVYFGSDTHAMGLLVGAALAAVWQPGRLPTQVSPRTGRLATALGVGGLVVMLGAFVLVGEASPFLYRGGLLVLAVATAAVIAVASHPALGFGRLLAHPVLRYVGSRSYGIYLWHWPIFMVTRPGLDLDQGGASVLLIRLALTFGAAELSYRYVEMPIRNGALARLWAARPIDRRRTAVVAAAFVMVPIVVFGSGLTMAASSGPEQALGGLTGEGDGQLQPLRTTSPRSGVPPVAGPSAPPNSSALEVTAVGDSVLLDAAPELKLLIPDLTVDARIGRQPRDIFDRIRERERAGRLGTAVIINAGSNGLVEPDELTEILTFLKGRQRVIVVTARGSKSWVGASNRAIATVTPKFANARIVDWADVSKGKRRWFWQDGLHMKDTGAARYADTVAGALRG